MSVVAAKTKYRRPAVALSDLSVTEFLTLSRVGFLPHGMVVGCAVYDAGVGAYQRRTHELDQMSEAMRAARAIAVSRMREQAKELDAEGVVGVRLNVEHHTWRGGHNVAKFVALGTAIAFDHEHGPEELQHAPPLRLADGEPFTSDLSGQDFVTLLRAGYRPVDLAMGCCVYEIDRTAVGTFNLRNEEIAEYTSAFFDAREAAMDRLAQDLFKRWPPGHPDAPAGVVGMTVTEMIHGEKAQLQLRQVPVVEFTAVGTAVAHLQPGDPRRAAQLPTPAIVVPLDR
jgi:uncharacterized protein YbjQ (UPF0145 family)|nr:heavy metal-binding domain-containing protein [Kofleriaceae bacterium]